MGTTDAAQDAPTPMLYCDAKQQNLV